MKAYPPLPLSARRDFAFLVPDPEGAPNASGRRFHAAVDWFSPAGTKVYAPHGGTVIESRDTGDISGQVFGGTVKVQDPEGVVWVFRHVVPTVRLGAKVDAGDPIAVVSQWLDWPGGTHAHHEIWKTAAGGYRVENMLNPADVDYTAAGFDTERPAFYFEERPYDEGGLGPKVVGNAEGYASAVKAKAARLRILRALPGKAIQIILADDGRRYLLAYAPGTYGRRFRFGPFPTDAKREQSRSNFEHSAGRRMRPYIGRSRSLYPWPKEG